MSDRMKTFFFAILQLTICSAKIFQVLSGKFNPLIFRSAVIHRKYWETKTTIGKVVTEEKKIFVKITVNHRKKWKTKTPFC